MAIIDLIELPDDYYSYDAKDVKTIIRALRRLRKSRQVMTADQAAAFLKISMKSFYKIKDLPYHTIQGLSGKLYVESELIDYIKRH